MSLWVFKFGFHFPTALPWKLEDSNLTQYPATMNEATCCTYAPELREGRERQHTAAHRPGPPRRRTSAAASGELPQRRRGPPWAPPPSQAPFASTSYARLLLCSAWNHLSAFPHQLTSQTSALLTVTAPPASVFRAPPPPCALGSGWESVSRAPYHTDLFTQFRDNRIVLPSRP